jgi:Na+-translocating ferredoxin:NAD+ oxidoreductase subunit B
MAAKGAGPQNVEHVSADVQAQIDAAEARRRRLGIATERDQQLQQNPDKPQAPASGNDTPRSKP